MFERLLKRFRPKRELTPEERADREEELPDLIETARYRDGRLDKGVDAHIGPPSGRVSSEDEHNR